MGPYQAVTASVYFFKGSIRLFRSPCTAYALLFDQPTLGQLGDRLIKQIMVGNRCVGRELSVDENVVVVVVVVLPCCRGYSCADMK